ncbi:MAG: cation-translocating P-type ATPase [Anaerolineae bacterium]|nr:cation-translocating P-type ATPase [Anaerolineae bacterium]
MDTTLQTSLDCECHPVKQGFFRRYRDFLLSTNTILTFLNAVLLLAGFLVSISGAPVIGRWLYLASALIGGMPLFIFAAKGLIIRNDITAGVMASTATIAAIIVGEYSAAALVVFMMSVGEWLENFTIARADRALQDLSKLTPSQVTVKRDGREVTLPLEEVQFGDIVLVRSGERSGVDGTIQAGSATINQSAITGESMPVEKAAGDEVFAGTLVESGAVEVLVEGIGEGTTLGQIIRLVKDAQASQAPVQRVANRYARILVPVTFGIAILVYLLTGDVMRSITVLVVVCPCALVLATPTAVVAAIGNAAKHGMLVKSGAVIEQVGRVDVVAFDKTGTLTYGKPRLLEVVPLNGMNSQQILNLAAAVERYSEHPIGKAIVQAAMEQSIHLSEPSNFEALPGYGVSAVVDGKAVLVGSQTLLKEKGAAWSEANCRQAQELESQGKTVIPVAVDHRAAGILALVDQPRPQARQAIQSLKQLGVSEVVMITGDNPHAAQRVADELGIDQVYAGVLPQEKLDIIRKYQQQGRRVVFAGDGVNDAPALAAADIGVAMGISGTDVAMETADIGLMADEIERLPQLLGLSRKTLRVIRQNVIFSMSMNVLSVILGGFGIIGPVFGALMHELSALPVLANSARLIQTRHTTPQ